MNTTKEPRKWEQALLAALRTGESLSGAARVARVHRTSVNSLAKRDPRFAAELAQARSTPRRKGAPAVPAPRKTANKIELFLARLAETSNVSAAAAEAELATATIYTLRRTDPEFARRWYAALAEGYDNLEMELLGQLRAGDGPGTGAEPAKGAGRAGRKLDAAAALRSLAAHRESVAREKGRRALAEEVTTIASINEKIDKLRLNEEAGAEAIAAARKDNAKRARRAGRAAQ